MRLNSFIEENSLDFHFKTSAKNWFIPLAHTIADCHAISRQTFAVGINGCQGSGKSTLALFLAETLKQKHNLSVAVLSLDDFYLSQKERLELAKSIHPLFQVRGVPGTHNTLLIKETLLDLKIKGRNVSLPRFNKATDNPSDKKEWPEIKAPVDIILMEGWCWGVPPQNNKELNTAINSLEEQQDPQGTWRRNVNDNITLNYNHLYQQIDFWVMLKAPGFDCVLEWRLQQEEALAKGMKNKSSGTIMSKQDIENFIPYFQRLTEHALKTMPSRCDLVYHLDHNRNIIKVDDSNR